MGILISTDIKKLVLRKGYLIKRTTFHLQKFLFLNKDSVPGMCQLGAWEGRRASQYCQLCKKVGQEAAMLQESWQQYFVFSANLFFLVPIDGQSLNTLPPPPTEGILAHHGIVLPIN